MDYVWRNWNCIRNNQGFYCLACKHSFQFFQIITFQKDLSNSIGNQRFMCCFLINCIPVLPVQFLTLSDVDKALTASSYIIWLLRKIAAQKVSFLYHLNSNSFFEPRKLAYTQLHNAFPPRITKIIPGFLEGEKLDTFHMVTENKTVNITFVDRFEKTLYVQFRNMSIVQCYTLSLCCTGQQI